MAIPMTLIDALRRAGAGQLPDGMLLLSSNRKPGAGTACLFVEQHDIDARLEAGDVAAPAAFKVEGLDQGDLANVVRSAEHLQADPDEDLLIEAFVYYWRHDAFLPARGAPKPRSMARQMLASDREFYDGLGDERAGTRCAHPGCGRGTVRFSVLCRPHHFEQMWKRASPFVH